MARGQGGQGGGGGLSTPALFDTDFRQAFVDWLVREQGKTGKSAQEYFYQLSDVTRVSGYVYMCVYAQAKHRAWTISHRLTHTRPSIHTTPSIRQSTSERACRRRTRP